MAMYENFARVYDTFMDDVPYDEWADHVIERLRGDGINDGLVLDLGCGTGSMTLRLSRAGYEMIGVDSSPDMLEIALEKKEKEKQDILFLQQDMRSFELYGTVRAIVCCCDSLNYLTDTEDLLQVFRLASNYLDPHGLFIFDMRTAHYYRDSLGEGIFAENRDDCAYIWENAWYEEEKINEYALTLFIQEQNGLYARYEEEHEECAYALTQVRTLLEQAGLKWEGVFADYSFLNGDETADRVLFVAREQKKGHF